MQVIFFDVVKASYNFFALSSQMQAALQVFLQTWCKWDILDAYSM